MPSTKTDTAVRFPQSEDQQPRIRNVTQDQRAASKAQASAASSKSKQEKAEESERLSPNQLLSEHMNSAGDPVPDAPTSAKGKGSKPFDDDVDVFEAMNADFE
ncbi:uncharacterized protein N7459_003226 [Penicillium hispanicum]|uniref:uncharacterized protein n=1 Tax=Penicillium hispanicum TaxID=1080232 RepID=UPI002540398F|nr:uncharacterized protein N7459_003226 [Penicillium hispanicum]KAJ5587461.1 hypothetical protein N7459_003226 [Penicillium hispanicum]